jgi:hypothetical protein
MEGKTMKHNLLIILAMIVAFIFFSYRHASAHGHIEVGNYELVIGFRNEPAYQGEPNGLDLFVTDTRTGERVNGLENSLRGEIIYGGSQKDLSLRPRFGQDGAYTADVLPTEAGDYTWHIFGSIGETAVDVSMTSGPDTFSPVISKSTIAFPSNEPSTMDILGSMDQATRTAGITLIVAVIGAVVGMIGLLVSLLALRSARRRV